MRAAHAAAAPETCSTMGAPWFGASPTATPLTLHRRGWGACALCGGAERLGASSTTSTRHHSRTSKPAQILDAVRAHGVVVLKGQNLTRSQQVAFTAALGEVVSCRTPSRARTRNRCTRRFKGYELLRERDLEGARFEVRGLLAPGRPVLAAAAAQRALGVALPERAAGGWRDGLRRPPRGAGDAVGAAARARGAACQSNFAALL